MSERERQRALCQFFFFVEVLYFLPSEGGGEESKSDYFNYFFFGGGESILIWIMATKCYCVGKEKKNNNFIFSLEK